MGRTLPTIVQTLRAEAEGWRLFRRALRSRDQEAFDALWRFARRHAAPAAMASRPMPFEAAVMGMLVGLARRVLDLEQGTSPALPHDAPAKMLTRDDDPADMPTRDNGSAVDGARRPTSSGAARAAEGDGGDPGAQRATEGDGGDPGAQRATGGDDGDPGGLAL